MPGGDTPAAEPGDVARRCNLGSCFLQFQGELVDRADQGGDGVDDVVRDWLTESYDAAGNGAWVAVMWVVSRSWVS